MNTFDITIPVAVMTDEELNETDRQLMELAKRATRTSYSPYSHFAVGAALLLENGEIITGSNQENAAYPVGCCAERTALFYANAHFPGVGIRAIAIAARNEDGFTAKPVSPCGMCRQALMETEHRYGPMRVLLYGAKGTYCLNSIADLLPLVFTSDDLNLA